MVGTVMARASITAKTGAIVNGRLLAQTGAVTLDSNTISLFVTAKVVFWTPNTFFAANTVIPDCLHGVFQWVIVPGTSGSVMPVFNTGPGSRTKEGPSTPQLEWGDPPDGLLYVMTPPVPAPPNVPPPPPQAPPAPSLIIVPGSEV
jgi:hypothetical protein